MIPLTHRRDRRHNDNKGVTRCLRPEEAEYAPGLALRGRTLEACVPRGKRSSRSDLRTQRLLIQARPKVIEPSSGLEWKPTAP